MGEMSKKNVVYVLMRAAENDEVYEQKIIGITMHYSRARITLKRAALKYIEDKEADHFWFDDEEIGEPRLEFDDAGYCIDVVSDYTDGSGYFSYITFCIVEMELDNFDEYFNNFKGGYRNE